MISPLEFSYQRLYLHFIIERVNFISIDTARGEIDMLPVIREKGVFRMFLKLGYVSILNVYFQIISLYNVCLVY